MAVPIFLSGQQIATAGDVWMCLMGAEKWMRWIEKATLVTGGTRLVPNPQKWYFFQEGAEAWRKHGPCQGPAACGQAVSSLPVPLLSLPGGSPGVHRDTQHVMASFRSCEEVSTAYQEPKNNGARRSQGCVQRVPRFPWAHGLLSADGRWSKY